MLIIEKYIQALPEEIIVEGGRDDDGEVVVLVNGELLSPELSLKIRNHSPAGFNAGYGGSGPAQLSLAILLLFLPVPLALRYYQSFKFEVVAKWTPRKFRETVNLFAIITKIEKSKTP